MGCCLLRHVLIEGENHCRRNLCQILCQGNVNSIRRTAASVVAAQVVEFGCSWAFVRGDLLRVLDGSAILQIGGNAGRPKGMVAYLARQASLLSASLYHVEGVSFAQAVLRQFPAATARASEEW